MRLILFLMTFFYITTVAVKMMIVFLLLPGIMRSVVYRADSGSPRELGIAHPQP